MYSVQFGSHANLVLPIIIFFSLSVKLNVTAISSKSINKLHAGETRMNKKSHEVAGLLGINGFLIYYCTGYVK